MPAKTPTTIQVEPAGVVASLVSVVALVVIARSDLGPVTSGAVAIVAHAVISAGLGLARMMDDR